MAVDLSADPMETLYSELDAKSMGALWRMRIPQGAATRRSRSYEERLRLSERLPAARRSTGPAALARNCQPLADGLAVES